MRRLLLAVAVLPFVVACGAVRAPVWRSVPLVAASRLAGIAALPAGEARHLEPLALSSRPIDLGLVQAPAYSQRIVIRNSNDPDNPPQAFALDSSRVITWQGNAGLDPIGGIPSGGWSTSTCNGLDNTGATNMRTQINACISAASSNTVVVIPAGTYLVSGGHINMKSNVALRGAQASASPWAPSANASMTILNIGSNRIQFDGGSTSTSFSPARPNGTSITAGYTKGATTITLSNASSPVNYTVGAVIAIYQNEDTAIIDDMNLDYLGEDHNIGGTDPHVLQSYYEITSKSSNDLGIDQPLYYVTPTPTGQSARIQTFGVQRAGVENMRVVGAGSDKGLVFFRFCRYCWVSGVETYNAGGSSAGSAHVWTQFSMNNEIRDSYAHVGTDNCSGSNYGFEFYHWNSRHKIENNIVTGTRHSIINEGGGSGFAVLYNYTDDNFEGLDPPCNSPDTSFLPEDQAFNHGSHPHMNLWEGNSMTSLWADHTQGSSSHGTAFRNRVRCQQTNITLTASPDFYTCVEVEKYNRFYNFVGNIIGRTSYTTGTVVCNSANCEWGGSSTRPYIFRFGMEEGPGGPWTDTQSRSTAVLYRNYDYITDGILTNDPGSSLPLANSLYYTGRPSWYPSGCTWPPVDPMGPTTNDLPAKKRLDGTTC